MKNGGVDKMTVSFRRNVDMVVDRALAYLDVSPDLHAQIKACNTIIQLQFPVKLDNGNYRVFKGWRAVHSDHRLPVKGGIVATKVTSQETGWLLT